MDRYFGRFNPTRQDRWIGDRETGAYLRKLSWTPIRRHQMVKADASPDDPALTLLLATAATAPPTSRHTRISTTSPRRPQELA